MRRFLQRFAALAPAEWDAAATAYAASAGSAAALAADRDLARAVERAGRTAERDAVLGPLAQLVRVDPDRASKDDPPPDGMLADASRVARPQTDGLHPVAEAALAALLALVVRDVLPARAFATLYAPFEVAIPPAALDG
ncbi:MAG TPA: hypothetical protein VGD56_00175 [Gemmatirosa sp.]